MKSIRPCGCAFFGFVWGLAAALPVLADDPAHATDATTIDASRNTLHGTVVEANREIETKYALLGVPPLTAAKLRDAIETAIDQIDQSDFPERVDLVQTFQQILATDKIPESVEFFISAIRGQYGEDSPHAGQRSVSVNFTFIVPTPRGTSDRRMIGLVDLVQTFRIIDTQRQSQSDHQFSDRAGSRSTKAGGASFLQQGTWWNLRFVDGNNPWQRGKTRIDAVKIIDTDPLRPNWIQVRFPKSIEEHFSILKPAATARDNPDLSIDDALAGWEKGVSKWKTLWINLDAVADANKVE